MKSNQFPHEVNRNDKYLQSKCQGKYFHEDDGKLSKEIWYIRKTLSYGEIEVMVHLQRYFAEVLVRVQL
jgi:hypothetical protein